MTRLRPLLALALCAAFNAQAGDTPLKAFARAERDCNKYPTPQARAECTQKEKETDAAIARERLQGDKIADGNPKKKNDLCFTRKATGEVVCPN